MEDSIDRRNKLYWVILFLLIVPVTLGFLWRWWLSGWTIGKSMGVQFDNWLSRYYLKNSAPSDLD